MVSLDTEVFVQNVKRLCALKQTTPTVACDESGAGRNLIPNLKKGSIPSVEKVQLLAQYLGVTTSELLGEVPDPAALDGPALQFAKTYLSLTPDARERILAAMLAEGRK